MTPDELSAAVAACFVARNGEHPMTPEDDEYVTAWYSPLEDVAVRGGRDAEELRVLMLAKRLPLPSYIRSDGVQMVTRDLLELPERAGGFDRLPAYFAAEFGDPGAALGAWDGYLAGQFVCLRSVEPSMMKRKDELVEAITARLADPHDTSADWLHDLHMLVDELDAIEPPFAPYDRLRFGGPVSRDRLIDDVRREFPDSRSRHGSIELRSAGGEARRQRGHNRQDDEHGPISA